MLANWRQRQAMPRRAAASGAVLRNAVELGGVIVQHAAREGGGLVARDLVVADHAGQRDAEGLADVAAGEIGGLFPAERVAEWIAVGGEQDLVGEDLEPLAEPAGERARRDDQRLLGEIEKRI